MAGIIDSFFVQVGLDASQFTIGQREADQAWTKTKDQTVAAAKQIEENTRKLATSFDTLKRQALEFFAVIMGASSIQSFISNITAANTELAVMSTNLGLQPQVIFEWGAAIKSAGGDAASAMSAFQTVAAKVFEMQRQGKGLPNEFWQLSAASHVAIDPSNAEALAESLSKAAAALAKMGQRPAAFQYLVHGGINPDMANVMIDNGANIKDALAKFHDIAPTDEQLKNSQELTKSWAGLTQNATALGRAIEDPLTKNLTPYLDSLSHWIRLNKDLIAQDVDGWVMKQADGLAGFVVQLNALATVMDKLRHGVLTSKELTPSWFPSGKTNAPGKIAGGIWDFLENIGNMDNIFKSPDDNSISPAGRLWRYLFPPAHAGELTPEELARGLGSGQPPPTPGDPAQFGAMPTMSDFQQGKLDVDGRPVSRGNPMPVSIANWAEGMANSFLGGPMGSGTRDSSPGGHVSSRGSGAPSSLRERGSRGVGGWWTDERMQHAAGRLEKEAGLSPMGAAGLVARWAAVEASGGPTAVNPRSGAAGINQALGERKPAGYSGMSFDQQLDYIVKKDLHDASQRRALDVLKNATTAAQAAAGASMYERAEGFNGVSDNYTNSTPVQRVYDAIHKKLLATGVKPPSSGSGSKESFGRPGTMHHHLLSLGKDGTSPPHTATPGLWHAGGTPTGPIIPAPRHPSPGEQSLLWNGTGGGAYPHLASLSTIAANNPTMTSSHVGPFHVGDIQVNAPNATDSKGIADSIADALQLSLHASLADYGQA
jgi:hypothetical protein